MPQEKKKILLFYFGKNWRPFDVGFDNSVVPVFDSAVHVAFPAAPAVTDAGADWLTARSNGGAVDDKSWRLRLSA